MAPERVHPVPVRRGPHPLRASRVSATRRLRSAAPAVGRRVLSGVHGRVFALIDAAAISIIIIVAPVQLLLRGERDVARRARRLHRVSLRERPKEVRGARMLAAQGGEL